MADKNYAHTDLSLYGRHTPDYSKEIDANGNPYQQELPGYYEIGTEIDGVFVPLVRLKAAGLFTDIQRAKSAQQPEQQPSGQPAVQPADAQQQTTPPEQPPSV